MPDCWLEVSLHPKGPATSQLDQGFPWFFSVLEQWLSWFPNSTLQRMFHMHTLPMVTPKFRLNVTLPMLDQISPFQRDIQINSGHTKKNAGSTSLLHTS
jgi:hypothetical protein